MKTLRAAVDARRTSGGRLRGDARVEVGRLIERAHGDGVSYVAIAKALGVGKVTLKRWRAPAKRTALAAVRIVEEPSVVPRAFIVHGPRGLRIEGLSLDELAALLGRVAP